VTAAHTSNYRSTQSATHIASRHRHGHAEKPSAQGDKQQLVVRLTLSSLTPRTGHRGRGKSASTRKELDVDWWTFRRPASRKVHSPRRGLRSTALLVTKLHRGGAEGARFACRSGNTIHSFIHSFIPRRGLGGAGQRRNRRPRCGTLVSKASGGGETSVSGNSISARTCCLRAHHQSTAQLAPRVGVVHSGRGRRTVSAVRGGRVAARLCYVMYVK
jgi:hypothetical protein